jgi:hypothetical protein
MTLFFRQKPLRTCVIADVGVLLHRLLPWATYARDSCEPKLISAGGKKRVRARAGPRESVGGKDRRGITVRAAGP